MPSVSIVIPARRAAGTIRDTIDAALAQETDAPIEVIVAVPPGDHETLQALATYGDRITVVTNPKGTAPAGLNAAIGAAGGDVIVRCDAHAVLPPGYVRRALTVLGETGAANVGGMQEAVGNSWLERAIAIAQTTPLGVGDARYRLGGGAGPVDTVYLGVFRRNVLDRLGGFDERFVRNQDYELNQRIRASGEQVWFDPQLLVRYRVRSSVASLARQYFDYGAGKRLMLGHHPASVRWRQLAAPALVLGLAASVVVAFTPWRWMSPVLPLVYLTTLVVTAPVLAIRRHDTAALGLPLVLPVMHLSWGLGFLTG